MATDYSALFGTTKPRNNPLDFSRAGGGSRMGPAGSGIGDVGPVDQPGWSSGGLGGGGYDWGKVIGGVAPLALSFLAPDGIDMAGPTKEAQDAARTLGKTGATQAGQGAEALGPVLHYLAAMTSGDPQALLAATMPERRRVMDQYDTARQASQFAPRGGGTSSALVNLNSREASDLAMIGGKGRSDAMKASADIGTALSTSGAQAQSASASHLTQLLDPLLKQQASDQESVFNTFASIAGMIGMFV